MRKRSFCLWNLFAYSFLGFIMQPAQATEPNHLDYQLEQVVILSRHGLRAPLANHDTILDRSTAYTWPIWDVPGGHLTTKGGVLETYFGHYFREWFLQQQLISNDTCPLTKDILIYANSLQRTLATAQFFALGAFPGCPISIKHQAQLGEMDPVFNPIIRTDSPDFTENAHRAMTQMAGENGLAGLNQSLQKAYDLLEKITQYQQSRYCLEQTHCTLNALPTSLIVEKNKEPGITGPLKHGTSLADAFILQYYEGFPDKDVAWGTPLSDTDWQQLVEIKNRYIDILMGSPFVAKHVAQPLIGYIDDTFKNPHPTKITVLVGHDSNMSSVLSALKIQPYMLPNQFEKTPIGGKVVFEKWVNKKSKESWARIRYVYQTTQQIRQTEKLDKHNLPASVPLQLSDCPVNRDGFCPWGDFQQILTQIRLAP